MPYSHREDFPLPPGAKPIFYQPFTKDEWAASNFAADDAVESFHDWRYGMFIHFGLSTYQNANLSWGICHTRKAPDCGNGPVADEEWQSWPKEFSLEKFDAQEWVRIAKDAGFRYLVLIAKHHDGFHMWDTAESEFKSTNTPFGRDVVKEVVDACHAAELPVGLYYSQRDWYHPDYMPVDPERVDDAGPRWTLKPGYDNPMGERHAKYLAYQENVVRELCTKYGKLDVFWWDAAWWGGMFTADMWDGERITRLIRDLQPGILINNRCSVPGDFDTPEGRLGTFQDWRPWESCICLTKSWSYDGSPPKPYDRIVRMLVSNACGDGNLLLSWGPHWDGEFDSAEKERLVEVGEWVKSNGESIFGTRGGPWRPNGWGGSTYRENTVYLHVVDLPGDVLELPALRERTVMSAELLDGTTVAFEADGDCLRLALPEAIRDDVDTIVVLTMNQPLDDVESIATGIQSVFTDTGTFGNAVEDGVTTRAAADGSVELILDDVRTLTGIRLEQDKSTACELTVAVSRDGDTWQDVGISADSVAEHAINGYHAGAWQPGFDGRIVRIIAGEDTSAVDALTNFTLFAKQAIHHSEIIDQR
jgi:alpha-L-fucosidase